MRKTIEIKDLFSRSLRRCLHAHYGKVPTASVLARDFNLHAYGIDPITQESARRWLRGVSIPEDDRLKIIVEWLHLDFNEVLCSSNNGAAKLQEVDKNIGNGLSEPDELLINMVFKLTPDEKKIVLELIKLIKH
jgi:hypothetical protein